MVGYSQAVFLYTTALKLADAATAVAVWYACWFLRFHGSMLPLPKGLPELHYYSRVTLPLAVVVSLMLHVAGAYRAERIQFGFRAVKKAVQGAVLGTLLFVATCYFLGEQDFSRVFLGLYAVLLSIVLVLERGFLHLLWKRWLRKKVRGIRVLLVGSGELLEMYLSKIQTRQPYPVRWLGRVSQGQAEAGPQTGKIPWLGSESDLPRILSEHRPEQVVVSYPEAAGAPAYAKILERLGEELVEVKILPDFGKYSTFTYLAKDECGIPLLAFNQTCVGNTDRVLKRTLDFGGALTILVVLSPLYALLCALVKLTSKGPVFFAQERVGADGKRFTLYKFRTMRTDAETFTGPVWAVENDPRTTAIGKWLRRTSLDEFPQFWNVLKGEMSLVGPRPERPEFVQQFRKEIPKYMLRHKMKSGITGWAQINGWRGNTSLKERIKHDLYYIGHWSHHLDLKILCLTLTKGFVNRHAY